MANGAMCQAHPGERYLVYWPEVGQVALGLEPGDYRAQWFNPRSGETLDLPGASGPQWVSPASPDSGDWALLVERRQTKP